MTRKSQGSLVFSIRSITLSRFIGDSVSAPFHEARRGGHSLFFGYLLRVTLFGQPHRCA
jgi:hypothetical protein